MSSRISRFLGISTMGAASREWHSVRLHHAVRAAAHSGGQPAFETAGPPWG